MSADRWSGFSLQTERDRAACLSWFPFAPDDVTVLLAEGYERDDGTTAKIRILVRRSDGKLRELVRSNNKANTVHKSGPPSPAILKRAKDRGVLEPAHAS